MEPEPEGAAGTLQVRKLWGERVLDVKTFGPGVRRVTVGQSEREADFGLPGVDLPARPYPVARVVGGEVRLAFPAGTRGCMRLGSGEMHALDDLHGRLWTGLDPDHAGCRTVALPEGACALLRFGQLGLSFRRVPRPAGHVSRLLDRIDTTFPNALMVALVFFVALIATFHLRPGEVSASSERLGRVPDRYVQFLLDRPRAAEPALFLLRNLTGRLDPENHAGQPAERLKGREGEAGAKDRPRTARRTASRGAPANDRRVVGRSGLVAVLAAEPAALPGTGGPGLGSDLAGAIGDLHGIEPGESGGRDGRWLAFDGPGGGRTGQTVGTADVRTRGRHGGDRDYGDIRRSTRKPDEREVVIRTGRLNVRGPLSMEMVRSVIDDHRHQIRYCYSRELIRNPRLSGKVSVRFTIGEKGYVSRAGVVYSNMDSASLTRCITARLRTWKFPAPHGGGSVIVNYPFLFHAPGS